MFSPLAVVVPVIQGGFFFWPFFIIGPIFFFLFIAFIFFLIFGRRRRMARGGGPWGSQGGWGSPARGAEATLAERFAQGDIDEKEYRARLEVLRANDTSQQPSN